jgi:surface polysaccharide O-acyltransferase-like enzyme
MFVLYSAIGGCTFAAIPDIVGSIVKLIYLAIRIGIPVILLIVGMVDLGKAVVAQKEDEIKKAQGLLVQKVIAAVIVFLLFTLIQFAINLVDKANAQANADMWTCVRSLLGEYPKGSDTSTLCPEGYKAGYNETTGLCSEG